MIDNTIVKKEFRSNTRKICWFQKKINRLDQSRQLRLIELKDKVPLEREAIKKEVKILRIKSELERLKGFDKKSTSYMNQGSVVIKSLKTISRYRKRKEIQFLNRNIRELESRIEPIRQSQINQELAIKEILFQEFIECGT